MNYGLHLPNFGPFGEPRTLATLAQEAEQAGWDGFFLWDHIARPWPAPLADPWVALAACALNTRRLRIGALVTPLPRRRPWKVARETITLDWLSGGRLIFGAGIGSSGGSEVEWENFGEETSPQVRGEMLDEGLEILRGLWGGRPFVFSGQHYRVKESQFLPVPSGERTIPVWIGGRWPNKPPFHRAARWDGVVPKIFPEAGDVLGQFKEAVTFTLGARKVDGPFDMAHITPARPDLPPAERGDMLAAFAEAGATWALEELTPGHFGVSWQGAWPFEAMRAYIRQGPPPP